MPLDKVLHKIQVQIDELAPTLEQFVDQTIQPSVDDCETLQAQLYHLLENLAVYKHHKLNKELSPSFNLHARISEAEPEIRHSERESEVKQPETEAPAPVKKPESQAENLKHHTFAQVKPFSVGLNDKFRFINELFSQNSAEYHIVVEQLNNLQTWSDTEIYLNSLKSVYLWPENHEVVKHFFSVIKKRFD